MGAHALSLLTALNGESALWAAHMAHACLAGGLFIAALWAVCRLALRLPAALRASLWWLACLKLAFDLCGFAPLPLPVLPAAPVAPAVHAALLLAVPSPASGPALAARSVPGKAVAAGDAVTTQPAVTTVAPSWLLGIQAVWLLGVLFGLALGLRQAVRLSGIVRVALPALLPEETLNALALQIGLRHAPRVLESHAVAAPCVTGLLRPTVLLPLGLTQTLTPEDLRLALAHEMAHVKRGDLRLALLPASMQALFFFHPLVWLAVAEWGNAREEACDLLAIQATGAAPAKLGRLLLQLAGGATRAPALGLSPGYLGLRRRLLGLTRRTASDRCARWLLVLVLPLLLPWRLVAANRTHPLTPSADDMGARQYGITDLGEVTDADSDAAALNGAGQVAGTARDTDQSSQGFAWNGGQAVALGALPKHHYSIAYGINAAGQIAAASYNIPGHGRAFLWNGTPHRIGSLPGFPYSEARGINDAGQVAGNAQAGTHDRWQAEIARAFLWQDGRMTDLGTLGGPYSDAYGLNNAGMVVGKADTDTFGQTHAFAWQDGRMTDLGTLGGANSLAYRVNDGGQIVGSSETGAGDTRHAFLWQNGQMRDLGVLPGTAYSVADDINSQGDIVGCAQPTLDSDSPARRAFLAHNGHLLDLNALLPPRSGWILAEARAINDKGQIAGEGQFHGHTHAFLLTPR